MAYVADPISDIKHDIREALVNQKGNSCPLAVRLAWHSSGTYAKDDNSGGSNGATMRFAPESDEGANAGLDAKRDTLLAVKRAHPEVRRHLETRRSRRNRDCGVNLTSLPLSLLR